MKKQNILWTISIFGILIMVSSIAFNSLLVLVLGIIIALGSALLMEEKNEKNDKVESKVQEELEE